MFFCAEGEGNGWTTWVFVALLVVLVAALLIVPMFTNKKRAKQANELHNSLKPGDVIKTIGGIIGTIVEVRQVSPTDKELVIETGIGDNKTTMVFDIQALYQVISRADAPVPPVEAQASQEPAADAEQGEAAEAIAQPVEQEVEAKSEEATVAVEAPATEEVKAEVSETETAAVDATTVSESEKVETEPVKKAPARKTAGKSSSAGKSTGAGKSAKKSADK